MSFKHLHAVTLSWWPTNSPYWYGLVNYRTKMVLVYLR